MYLYLSLMMYISKRYLNIFQNELICDDIVP